MPNWAFSHKLQNRRNNKNALLFARRFYLYGVLKKLRFTSLTLQHEYAFVSFWLVNQQLLEQEHAYIGVLYATASILYDKSD